VKPSNSAQEPTDPRRNLLWEDRPMQGEGSVAQRQGRYAYRPRGCSCRSYTAGLNYGS
jgi:hypothetical protein